MAGHIRDPRRPQADRPHRLRTPRRRGVGPRGRGQGRVLQPEVAAEIPAQEQRVLEAAAAEEEDIGAIWIDSAYADVKPVIEHAWEVDTGLPQVFLYSTVEGKGDRSAVSYLLALRLGRLGRRLVFWAQLPLLPGGHRGFIYDGTR